MATSYSPKIITDGLVQCLDAADKKSYSGSGNTWTDRSGNGYNATLASTTFSGDYGGILNLATSSTINLGNTSLEESSPDGSIGVWFKTSSTSTSQEVFYTKEMRDRVIYIYDNGSGHTYNGGAFNGQTNNYRLLDSGVSVTIDWVHIFLTYTQNNGSNAVYKLYVNGVEKSSDTTSTTTDVGSDNHSYIGGSSFSGSNNNYPSVGYFQGGVANFTNYSRVLTASEILQNYNATKGRFGL